MDRTQYLSQLHAQFGVDDQEITRVVERATGRSVADSRRIIKGDEREVHQVRLDDGTSVYLRIAFPGTPHRRTQHEAWAMTRAGEAGVPAPEVLDVAMFNTADGERAGMVMREATGQPLADVESDLKTEDRRRLWTDIGGMLRTLHSISMPGPGNPDEHGVWADPEAKHDSYVSDCLADCESLTRAGLSPAEVDQVRVVLQEPLLPVEDHVLCHGDVYAEHVFVDSDLHITGLIDWGMWHAGTAIAELAGLATGIDPSDFEAVLTGHGHPDKGDSYDLLFRWHTVAQMTGQIRWLVSSEQFEELAGPTDALRRSLIMNRRRPL